MSRFQAKMLQNTGENWATPRKLPPILVGVSWWSRQPKYGNALINKAQFAGFEKSARNPAAFWHCVRYRARSGANFDNFLDG